MKVIIFIAIVFAVLILLDLSKRKKAEKEERERQVALLAYKIHDLLEKIMSLKTSSAKINNCGKALLLLNQAEEYEECRQVIKNFDELQNRLIRIQQVLPIVDYVEKSYKHRFKNKDSSEKNTLLDALFEIKTKGITNQDILEAEVYPESTGEIITIEGIIGRLKELGWEEGENNSRIKKTTIKTEHVDKMTEDGRYIID